MAWSKFLAAAVGVASLSYGVAEAADLPYRAAPPPPPPPLFTWTGGYLGSVVGIDFLNGKADPRCITAGGAACPVLPSQKLRSTSYLLGATSGYNLQFGQIVLGVESDIQSTGLNKTSFFSSATAGFAGNPGSAFAREQINAFGTARGRIGFAWDRALLYATGGVMYANVNLVTNQVTNAPGGAAAFIGHSNSSHLGWVAGAGVEYAFSDRWSAKVEGLYYDLGSKTLIPTDITGTAPAGLAGGARFRIDGEMVRAGLNYKFGSLW